MKCPNCGAEGYGKFCQHCGTQMPAGEEPKTIAGAIHGIARELIRENNEKARYEREHADEIAERKRKEQAENDKRSRKALFTFVFVMIGMMTFFVLLTIINNQYHIFD